MLLSSPAFLLHPKGRTDTLPFCMSCCRKIKKCTPIKGCSFFSKLSHFLVAALPFIWLSCACSDVLCGIKGNEWTKWECIYLFIYSQHTNFDRRRNDTSSIVEYSSKFLCSRSSPCKAAGNTMKLIWGFWKLKYWSCLILKQSMYNECLLHWHNNSYFRLELVFRKCGNTI